MMSAFASIRRILSPSNKRSKTLSSSESTATDNTTNNGSELDRILQLIEVSDIQILEAVSEADCPLTYRPLQ